MTDKNIDVPFDPLVLSNKDLKQIVLAKLNAENLYIIPD